MAGQANWLERWLARWDAHNQRAIKRETAELRRQPGRELTATAPDGTAYQVVAVRAGMPLRRPELGTGGGALDLVLIPVAMVVLVVDWLRMRRHSGWTVGVLRPRRWWWAQVVYREQLGTGDDELARVAELAEQIKRGGFPPAGWGAVRPP